MQQKTSPLAAPLQSQQEAESLADVLEDTLEKLSNLLAEETNLAKSGKLRDAVNLQPEKARLTESFIKAAERFRANSNYFKSGFPNTVTRIRRLHEKFHAEVARNMTALATATALSESLINEIVETVQEHACPAGYTSGGNSPVNRKSATPLKLNLSL